MLIKFCCVVIRLIRNFYAQVITNLDQRWGLWQKNKAPASAEDSNGGGSEEKKEEEQKAADSSDFGITSTNPVLNNITDYLVRISSVSGGKVCLDIVQDNRTDS